MLSSVPTQQGVKVPEDAASGTEQVPTWIGVAATILVCLGLANPLLGLPWFDVGYYNLVAASIIEMRAIGGMGATLLIIVFVRYYRLAYAASLNPVSLAFAGFGLISGIGGFLGSYPMLSLLGSPQIGQGVLWFWETAVFVAVARLIPMQRGYWIAVLAIAVAVVATVTGVLIAVRTGVADLLLRGGDSYAYLGLLLPFLALSTREDARAKLFFALVVPAIAITAVSTNISAILILAAMLAFFSLAQYLPFATRLLSELRFSAVFLTFFSGVALSVILLVSLPPDGSYDSLDSRLLIARIVFGGLSDGNVLETVFGRGWGQMQLGFYQYLNESGASLIGNRWDFLWRDMFHAHNIALHFLYEIGVANLLFFLALAAAFCVTVRAELKTAAFTFTIGYLLVSCVWFEYIHTLPMLALVLALFSRSIPDLNGRLALRLKRPIILVLLSVMAAGSFIATGRLLAFDIDVRAFKVDRGALSEPEYPADAFPVDPRGYDLIKASIYRDVIRALPGVANIDRPLALATIRAILDDIQTNLDETTNPELLLIGLITFDEAHFLEDRTWLMPAVQDREGLWHRIVRHHYHLAPSRTDVLVGYFSWFVTQGRSNEVVPVLNNILNADPNDPVALYFNGVIAITTGQSHEDQEAGFRGIASALRYGVDRMIDVPDWIKQRAAGAELRYRQTAE